MPGANAPPGEFSPRSLTERTLERQSLVSIIQRLLGRVLLLRCDGPLDGTGVSPQEILDRMRACGARVVLVDVTQSPYVDSNGIRWLLKLHGAMEEWGKHLRIAARRGAGVWRILTMMGPVTRRLQVFDGVIGAWRARPPMSAPDGGALAAS